MKRSRYSEEQVIAVLKAIEAGAKTTDLLRKRGVSEAPLCHWKARYSSTDASFAWRGGVRLIRTSLRFRGRAGLRPQPTRAIREERHHEAI